MQKTNGNDYRLLNQTESDYGKIHSTMITIENYKENPLHCILPVQQQREEEWPSVWNVPWEPVKRSDDLRACKIRKFPFPYRYQQNDGDVQGATYI